MFEPFDEKIEIGILDNVSGNLVLLPLNLLSILSRTWSSPIVQPVNLSSVVFSISILNSLKETPVVGMPIDPPTGNVRTWPSPYPYPVLVISKSIILDPWPTTILILACVPIPEDVEL